MVNCSVPRNRGPNHVVTLDLSAFSECLFAAVGAKVQFHGPGALEHRWTDARSARHERFAISYLAKEMFSKFDDKQSSESKRNTAINRFWDAEVLCSLTNQKFCPLSSGQDPDWLAPAEEYRSLGADYDFVRSCLFRARRHLSRALGGFPGWEAVIPYCGFGPGASTSLSRRKSQSYNKWGGSPHVTAFPSNALASLFGELPLLAERFAAPGYEIVAGNKLEWVPKNYKTDRTIAIEPDWNMFLQKGLGGFIRRRLRRVKQDLNDQSVNQFLAGIGSIDGSLATLDMSMASDTVSYRLVEWMFGLRPDWFAELEQLRSPVGFIKTSSGQHEMLVFEKFSSMGNGFTFELESLIFWAIARGVSDVCEERDHRIYVYGDDIVCPTGIASKVTLVLRHCGFMVNEDKSFTSGPFRESCGYHSFEGYDVTPFYVREPVDSLDRLFLLHNNVYRWFHRLEGICDPERVREVLLWIRSHAPPEWRTPRLNRLDIGDGGFIGSDAELAVIPIARKRVRRRYPYVGWEGWAATVLQYTLRHVRCTHSKEEGCADCTYPVNTGPDLASLWSLESQHITAVSGRPSEIPYRDRWWRVGTQVLPWKGEYSWFNC